MQTFIPVSYTHLWQTAIGLQAVDCLKPSEYLIETARKHIEGDITIDAVQQLIKNYYESKDVQSEKEMCIRDSHTSRPLSVGRMQTYN